MTLVACLARPAQVSAQLNGFTDGMNASLVLGQPTFTTNASGSGPANLSDPLSVFADANGNIWVADAGNNRFLKFQPPFSSGMNPSLILSSFTYPGGGGQFTSAWAITIDSSGNAWVSDSVNNRVIEFKPPFYNGMEASLVLGQPDFTQTASGATQSGLYVPRGVAFDASGDAWVADSYNNRVVEYRPPFSNGMNASLVIGQPNFTSSGTGSGPANLSRPSSVAFDSSGNLFVAQSATGDFPVVQFVPPFSDGMNSSLSIYLPIWDIHYLSGILDILFDVSGDLWVASASCAQALVPPFSAYSNMNANVNPQLVLGTYLGLYGSTPEYVCENGAGYHSQNLMSQVSGISIDRSGNLWAADSGNNRVMEFSTKPSNFTETTVADVAISNNPIRPSLGLTSSVISNLPANSRLRIYTFNGLLVKDIAVDGSGTATWDATNESGRPVASGVYFLFAQGGGTKHVFKIAVQR